MPTTTIRRATPADEAALSRICLLTADAGTTAEHLHFYPEFPGLVYSVPYLHLPTTFGFVLVTSDSDAGARVQGEEVIGYVVGALDTRAFELAAEETWWPPLRAKYTLDSAAKGNLKSGDETYMKMLHDTTRIAPSECIAFSPAHLHINILPSYQRQGSGRKLVGTAVEYMRGEGLEFAWLGLDPRNKEAEKFYSRIGFETLEAPGVCMGLKFVNFH